MGLVDPTKAGNNALAILILGGFFYLIYMTMNKNKLNFLKNAFKKK